MDILYECNGQTKFFVEWYFWTVGPCSFWQEETSEKHLESYTNWSLRIGSIIRHKLWLLITGTKKYSIPITKLECAYNITFLYCTNWYEYFYLVFVKYRLHQEVSDNNVAVLTIFLQLRIQIEVKNIIALWQQVEQVFASQIGWWIYGGPIQANYQTFALCMSAVKNLKSLTFLFWQVCESR